MMDDAHLCAACSSLARRHIQAGGDLRGYPALSADEESEATLAAAPPEKSEKKPKLQPLTA